MPLARIRTEGFQRVIAHLDNIDLKADDLTVPLKQAGLIMLSSIEKNFEGQGRPAPWAPLSPGYARWKARWKARRGFSSSILTLSGQLRRSIAFETTPMSLKIGTAVRYAPFHQFGTRNMPMRKFLIFQDEDLDQIKILVNDYIQE